MFLLPTNEKLIDVVTIEYSAVISHCGVCVALCQWRPRSGSVLKVKIVPLPLLDESHSISSSVRSSVTLRSSEVPAVRTTEDQWQNLNQMATETFEASKGLERN